MGTIVVTGQQQGKRLLTLQLHSDATVEPVKQMMYAFTHENAPPSLFGGEVAKDFRKLAETIYGPLEWDANYCR